MVNNRKFFGTLLPGVDHLRHTHDLEHNAFSRGVPEWGAHLADDLERLVALHDASTIAAVIVEPVAGSAGVLLPPKGYLQRLRTIRDKHGIVLIFDEVITGFGRLGTPFGAHYFDVLPDMITSAKALTNGAIPMGAVFVRKHIYDTFMKGPENGIELFHGYTYSAHPAACAAGLAVQDIYDREGLLTRAAKMAKTFEEAVHSLRGLPRIIDIRNIGLVAGIELEPRPGAPAARAYEIFVKAFEQGILIRTTGDTLALSPPLIVEAEQIDQLVSTLRELIKEVR
jgi:beta-alanine--pyruvate transaminase